MTWLRRSQALLSASLFIFPAYAVLAQEQVAAAGALLSRPARLQVANVSLRAALAELVERSEVPIALSPSRVPKDVQVSCACDTLTVGAALTVLLANTSMTFSEAGGYILLIPSSMSRQRIEGTYQAITRDLATAEIDGQRVAQVMMRPALPAVLLEPAVISGTVRSVGGSAVPNALVAFPRLQLSTQTNDLGVYQLHVPEDRVTSRVDTLRVTRIGLVPASVSFQLRPGQIRVDVVMTEQAVALDQVVVSGTAGTQLRRAQSAEVATVNAAQVVATAPVTSVQQLLTSRVPGVSVDPSNGATGSTSLIRIRGMSSISLSNEPLVFIDGVRMDYRHITIGGGTGNVSTLTDLDPNDIESIEVVKGPAAATLYGSDASAGVIQILTKRGIRGASQFRQSISADFARIEPNWTPPSNFARCGAADVTATSLNPLCRGQAVGTLISDNPLLREGLLSNGHGTSVRWTGRGGDRGYGYYTSLGYTRETGVLPQNQLRQTAARVNFDFTPRQELTLSASFGLTRDVNDQPQLGDGTYSMLLALVGNPLSLGAAANGWIIPGRTGSAISNILNEFTSTRVLPSVKVSYNPLAWFTNRLIIGTDLSRVQYERFLPRNDQGWYTPTENTGFVQENRYGFDTHNIDYLGNVGRTFGASGDIRADLSFGVQAIAAHADSILSSGSGFASNASNVVSSATIVTAGGGESDQRSLGYLGQLQLGLRDRLFTQIGARIDKNSAFGTAAGSFFLPRFGMSYVISDEPFWRRSLPFVNTLLLRAAYGTTGRSPTPGASLTTFAPAPYVSSPGVSSPGIVPLSPGNPNLRAERGTEFETGFESGVWNDRAGFKLTYFDKITRDLLLQNPLPPSEGFTAAPFVNIGRVVNRGIEGQLRGEVVKTDLFSWEMRVGFNTLRNRVESLGGLAPIRVGIQNSSHVRVGDPLGVFYGRRVVSVDEVNKRATVSDTAEYIGNPIPTSEGNLASDLTLLRNVRVSGLVEWKRGYKKFNLTDWFRERSSTISERYQNRTDLPLAEQLRLFGPYVDRAGTTVAASSIFEDYIQDASFVRFRELSLTVDVPPGIARTMRAASASLTIGGRNLGLWTKYEHGDPESVTYVPRDGRFAAAEFNTLPQTRRWFTRVNLGF